jgi:hypothetical protein
MNQHFIQCKDRRTAKRLAPYAAKIVKVEGGFLAFRFIVDYETWKKQK